MRISGQLLIGQSAVSGQNGEFRAIEAATGEPLEPAFGGASVHDLETACALADAAFDTYRETSLDARAAFLDAIGRQILALGDALIVYWSGWHTVSWLLGLQIVMFVIYLACRRWVPTAHLSLAEQVRSSAWLIAF